MKKIANIVLGLTLVFFSLNAFSDSDRGVLDELYFTQKHHELLVGGSCHSRKVKVGKCMESFFIIIAMDHIRKHADFYKSLVQVKYNMQDKDRLDALSANDIFRDVLHQLAGDLEDSGTLLRYINK